MDKIRERYKATLTTIRPGEVPVSREGRLSIEVANATTKKLVVGGPRLTVGATGDNEICLPGTGVSRVHCQFAIERGGARVRDLHSKNGTWVGGVRLNEAWLPVGASVQIDQYTLTLRSLGKLDVPVSTKVHFGDLLGESEAMGEVFAILSRLADEPIDVLIDGETGTGKSLAARELHLATNGPDSPFVVVDCASLRQQTAETVLFGSAEVTGLLEAAQDGTVVFEEIGELSDSLQAALLGTLESRAFSPVNTTRTAELRARVVATSSHDLLGMVSDRRFRPGLYFRLTQAVLSMPRLRDRGAKDVTSLFRHFVSRGAGGTMPVSVSDDAVTRLVAHAWPGNVRELLHAAVRAGAAAEGRVLGGEDVAFVGERRSGLLAVSGDDAVAAALGRPWRKALEMFRQAYAERLLTESGGNRSEAARRAEVSRTTLLRLLAGGD